jgi:serine/threonine protein kinase
MSDDSPIHPHPDCLAAFGLGKLGPAESAAVEAHLAGCDLCGRAVQALPADAFVALVRQAAPIGEMNLAHLVACRGKLPPGEACVLVRQAALTLQTIPEPGLALRDISPEGLVRTPDGRVEVRKTTPPPRGAASEPGTVTLVPGRTKARYIASNQASGPSLPDARSAVYSLGCVLHFLLAGYPPTPPTTIPVTHDLPAGLAAMLERMLDPDPGRRYQTPAQVAEALIQFAVTEPA